MKIIRIIIVIIALLMTNINVLFSQLSDENWDLMLIRNDKVYTSMTMEYERTLVDLKDYLSTKNIEGFNYFTHLRDDYSFTHAIPLNELSDMSKGIHSVLAKQINDPEFNTIITRLKKNLRSYQYYIVKFEKDLSYIPEGDDWGENSSYRRWTYLYCQPGKESEVKEVLENWRKLYEAKDVEMGFRVFTGFLGIEQPLYILTTWAENALEYQLNIEKSSKILGEEGISLWNNMYEFVNTTETLEGWYLQQYSFAPNLKMAE